MENKKSKVDLVFILDRSGSMQGLEKETIAGFNRVLNEQRKREMDIAVTTILFDEQYEVLHPRINIQEVRSINGEQYFVRGSTALYDAIGKTIEE